jgi:peptidoglycan/LPS O-acetylase OafA/YrhL
MIKGGNLTRMKSEQRIPALDLLRGFAALAVAVPHFFMFTRAQPSLIWETLSISAVDVFFVLSGFVLGYQILLCAERRDFATLSTFLMRRWMRTIPSYLFALLAGAPALFVRFPPICRLYSKPVFPGEHTGLFSGGVEPLG